MKLTDCNNKKLVLGQKVIYIGAEPDTLRILKKGRIVELGSVATIGKHFTSCTCSSCKSGSYDTKEIPYIGIQIDTGKIIKRTGADISTQVFVYE